jgi:hypothetical protein
VVQHLQESEYDAIIDASRLGKASIHIPKAVARRFFTHVKGNSIQDVTGLSVVPRKVVIWLCIVLSLLSFLLFATTMLYLYGPTLASILIPLGGIFWIIIFGLASDHGDWWHGTVPLIACFLLYLDGQSFSQPLLLFVFSLWLHRASYLLAEKWLRDLVSHSFAAFKALEDHINITSKSLT